MPAYHVKSIIGTLYFNEHGKEISKPKNSEDATKKLLKKIDLTKYKDEFRKKNISQTIKQIKDSFTEDIHINQCISAIEELNRILNQLTKRAREWYAHFNPEFEHSLNNNEKFIELIQTENINSKMGAIPTDLNIIQNYAKKIQIMYKEREDLEHYLNKKLLTLAPNTQEIVGTLITAKLIQHAGSVRRLALMPASTIQLLGAEKALFRHLKNKKALCPKFGVIFNHPLISQSKKSEQGKVARSVADKISIAIKVDFFKGQPIGNKLKSELEKKFKK